MKTRKGKASKVKVLSSMTQKAPNRKRGDLVVAMNVVKHVLGEVISAHDKSKSTKRSPKKRVTKPRAPEGT